MYFPQRISNYDKYPVIEVQGHNGEAWGGYAEFLPELRLALLRLNKKKQILIIDCYHGVRIE
jgi:hypothetical protein